VMRQITTPAAAPRPRESVYDCKQGPGSPGYLDTWGNSRQEGPPPDKDYAFDNAEDVEEDDGSPAVASSMTFRWKRGNAVDLVFAAR